MMGSTSDGLSDDEGCRGSKSGSKDGEIGVR